jgi:MarR family transcriptional regulator for hemolysin
MVPADFLNCGASAAKGYEAACGPVCRQYHLTQTALNILLFLANNPGYNTARDICMLRGIKTGIASVAVEALMQAGYLVRRRDEADRRIQRLTLTPAAAPLVAAGRAAQKQFIEAIFQGVSAEECVGFSATLQKVTANIRCLSSVSARKEF